MLSLWECFVRRGATIIALMCILTSIGCVETPSTDGAIISQPHPTTATVVVGSLKGVLNESTPLSWYPKNFVDLSDVSYLSPDQQSTVDQTIRKKVESEFVTKGIQFQSPVGSTRFQVVLAGAGSDNKVEELQALFKVYPGLGQHSMQMGAVMIAVVDTARNYSVWRGVVEGTTDPNVLLEERLTRLQSVVQSLLNRIEL